MGPIRGPKTSMWGGQLGFDNTIYYIDHYLEIKKQNINSEMPFMFFSGKVAVGQGQEIKTIADRQTWDKETNAD